MLSFINSFTKTLAPNLAVLLALPMGFEEFSCVTPLKQKENTHPHNDLKTAKTRKVNHYFWRLVIYACFSLWVWAHRLTLWSLALVCYGFLGQRNGKEIKPSFQSLLSPSRPNEPSCLRPFFLPVSIDFSGIMTSIRPSHWDISWYAVLHATKPWRWRDGKGDSEGGKVLTRFSLPWPTVSMLVGPIQQLLPRLWLPKSFSYKWSKRIQKQIMPFLVLARW